MARQAHKGGKSISTSGDDEHKRLTERISVAVGRLGSLVRAGDVAGVSDETVAKWRNGRSRPPFIGLVSLCDAAGLSLQWMATGEGPREASAVMQQSMGGGMRQALPAPVAPPAPPEPQGRHPEADAVGHFDLRRVDLDADRKPLVLRLGDARAIDRLLDTVKVNPHLLDDVAALARLRNQTLSLLRKQDEVPTNDLSSIPDANISRSDGSEPAVDGDYAVSLSRDGETLSLADRVAGLVMLPTLQSDQQTGSLDMLDEGAITVMAAFDPAFLREQRISEEGARLMKVNGDTMDSIFRQGDYLIVDAAVQAIVGSGFYALFLSKSVELKRAIVRLDGSVILRSDNTNAGIPDEHIPPERVESLPVAGRVMLHVRGI